ncbi:RING finger protein unkempt [Araneus ventricosus]|uniref:RING finger protein unkempt n=1 Tax=Araneus ventricosus TaxID=182803 RepID=A0A4Y2NMN2_ARAVE|nr:RING finger protein unkempt [Araneus ventricosus]GBN40172.1 RING finger protein unkempt [Araneus ventricosus]
METNEEGPNGLAGPNHLYKERNALNEDSKWQDTNYVLANYETEQCKRLLGYACPSFHNIRDHGRSPKKCKYRSTPCPNVKQADEWGDPANCENGDSCPYCHTRTEQQFHPESNAVDHYPSSNHPLPNPISRPPSYSSSTNHFGESMPHYPKAPGSEREDREALSKVNSLQKELDELTGGPFLHSLTRISELETLPLMELKQIKEQLREDLDKIEKVTFYQTATECMKCEDWNRSITVVPSSHYALCNQCAPHQKNCPYCHEEITSLSNASL